MYGYAANLADILDVPRHVPMDEPIDLLNVAFENPRKIQVQVDGNIGALPKRERKRLLQALDTNGKGTGNKELSSHMVPDRVTGLQEVEELRRLCPGRVWNFVSLAYCASSHALCSKMIQG
jgi:hypothetical protein